MKTKKTQINQVFVYLLSFIVIAFIGFLVTKFIFTFTGDVDSRLDVKLYDELKLDYRSVYQRYDSEKVLEYRLTGGVTEVCFISQNSCINSLNISDNKKISLNKSFEGGDNVAVFDFNDIVNSQNIGDFKGLCDCLKPKKNRIKLVMENRQNEVWLSSLE